MGRKRLQKSCNFMWMECSSGYVYISWLKLCNWHRRKWGSGLCCTSFAFALWAEVPARFLILSKKAGLFYLWRGERCKTTGPCWNKQKCRKRANGLPVVINAALCCLKRFTFNSFDFLIPIYDQYNAAFRWGKVSEIWYYRWSACSQSLGLCFLRWLVWHREFFNFSVLG